MYKYVQIFTCYDPDTIKSFYEYTVVYIYKREEWRVGDTTQKAAG